MTVKIVGLDKLQNKLKDNVTLDDVKVVVKKNTADLNSKMARNTPYKSGTLRRSIRPEITNGGLEGIVGTNVHYAPYVEYGTRFMEAKEFAKSAFDKVSPKFTSDIEKLMR